MLAGALLAGLVECREARARLGLRLFECVLRDEFPGQQRLEPLLVFRGEGALEFKPLSIGFRRRYGVRDGLELAAG